MLFLIPLLSIIFISNSFKGAKTNHQSVCEVVSGEGHLYKGQCLSDNFTPEVFVLSKRASWLNTTPTLDLRARVMVEDLIIEAEKNGMCLVVASGYRSYEQQKVLYDDSEDKNEVAIAGGSEHQTGLAVDFTACPMRNGIREDSVERLELKKFNPILRKMTIHKEIK